RSRHAMDQGGTRFETRAALRDAVVAAELPKRVHHGGGALVAEAAQVKAPDDGVNLRDARHARRVPADPDDAAMRARRDHDESATANVRDHRLLADERVRHDLAVALDLQVRG